MSPSPTSCFPTESVLDRRATVPGEKSALAVRHGSAPTVGETATMILDRLGRILSCGTPAECLFGTSQHQLMGRRIAEFIAGLLLEGRSPSFDARYLAHLYREGGWREFGAMNAAGITFAVDLNLSRIASRGREIYLLNVRRLEETATP